MRVLEHLDDALFVELVETLAELFRLAGVDRASRGEHLGCERRDRGEPDRRARLVVQRVADVEARGIDESDDVAGERLVDGRAFGAEHGRRVLGGERLAGAFAGHHHAAVEPAGADAGEGDAVAVVAIHVGLHLEHERRARLFEVARFVVDVESGGRRRGEVDDGVEQVSDAEVGEGRSGEHRSGLAGEERRHVDVGPHRAQELRFLGALRPRSTFFIGGPLGGDVLLGRDLRTTGGAGEAGEHVGATIDDAAQVTVRPDRPGGRRGAQADLLLDLVEQLERIHAGPVELVEEGDHRQIPRPADLEQLERLGFDALGRVEHHHDRVDGRQHPVGVFGEVAVARRVEQVQFVIAVREVQRRRGDRDTTLLLHVHPVGRGGATALVGLDGATRRDRTRIQQELLGERGLAGVGVTDDRERTTTRRFAEHLGRHLFEATVGL